MRLTPLCLALGAATLLANPALRAADAATVAFETSDLRAAARLLPDSGTLRVAGVPLSLDGRVEVRDLLVERFEVFAADARIVLHTEAGERLLPLPANVYLRGRIDGDPLSRVTLSVLETGEVRGLAVAAGHIWILGSDAGDDADGGDAALAVRQVDPAFDLESGRGHGFRCELDGMGAAGYRAGMPGDDDSGPLSSLFDPAAGGAAASPEGGPYDHTARIAIETDNEFLALGSIGGNTTTATNYIADLVAYASTIYWDELQTSWSLGSVSLWAVADPWNQANAACGLLEFGRDWNLNHGGTTRTVAHLLSGKPIGSGIAWVGVLCSGGFTAGPATVGQASCAAPVNGSGNFGGGYGYTGGIAGNFNIDSPSVVWDLLALTHEIGHNFNSPHTHCYQNVGGNAASVDNCYSGQCGTTGCFCGTGALPGPSGVGSGTIMSYCHQFSPGLSNISLTLGLGHPMGVMPERVPSRMRSHVVSVAGGNPSCLAPIGILFVDGFGSGNTSAWSDTVP